MIIGHLHGTKCAQSRLMRRSKRRCNTPPGIIGAFACPDVLEGREFVVNIQGGRGFDRLALKRLVELT